MILNGELIDNIVRFLIVAERYMTTENDQPYSAEDLERMNSKALENQFFTPDHVYIEMALIKDFPIGVIYADLMSKNDARLFERVQAQIMEVIHAYQKRDFDTVDPHFGLIGYTDAKIDQLIASNLSHDSIFLMAPTTQFFNTLIGHTIRNQNNSGPANKFTKRRIDKEHYALDAIPVTYYINTYPLNLSEQLLNQLAPELGESFGVNIQFLSKHPSLFDRNDWETWLKKIECFYLHSLGRFTCGDLILDKQHNLELMGCYIFARKRFPTELGINMPRKEFEQQIPLIETMQGTLCDFAWLDNNDVRLTEDAEQSASDTDAATPDEEQTT